MPSRQTSTSLKAIVLAGLMVLSGSTTASFIEHSNHQIVAEPKLKIPSSLRGHSHHHPHGSYSRRNKASVHQKRAEAVVVEVPFTIWTGSFEGLERRSPGPAKDKEDTTSTTTDTTSGEDACTGIVCPKNTYCTSSGDFTGCCPIGKKCTGIKTCLDATDSQCPDDIACCPDRSPTCGVTNGQGVCMKEKAPTTTSEPPKPALTSETPKPSSTRVTKEDVTTTSELKTTSTTSSTETSTTSSTETSTSPTATSTTAPTAPIVPVPVDQSTPTPDPVTIPTDVLSTTAASPTPSATAANGDVSSSTKIISSAIAGSIVALAFGTLIIYTIVKKRKENALARAEEASKAAPLASTSSAAPMGSGGNGRPFSIQPEPEMLQMATQAPTAVFTSGPQQGRSLREGIPPATPPPNAMVVGTPPYRREQYRGEPGTPTSLRVGVPSPQFPREAQWSPAVGYSQNFPFPDEPFPVQSGMRTPAGYSSPGVHTPEDAGVYTPGEYSSPGVHTPSTGSYQAYSPPGTPGNPPMRGPHSPY